MALVTFSGGASSPWRVSANREHCIHAWRFDLARTKSCCLELADAGLQGKALLQGVRKKTPQPTRSQVKQRGKRILQSTYSRGRISLENF